MKSFSPGQSAWTAQAGLSQSFSQMHGASFPQSIHHNVIAALLLFYIDRVCNFVLWAGGLHLQIKSLIDIKIVLS